MEARLVGLLIFLALLQITNAGVECGRQARGYEPNGKKRIINGQIARQHSWPWMISQRYQGNPWCGASLLRIREDIEASDIILTAAHCVPEKSQNNPTWTAVANLHKQSNAIDIETRKIISAKIHPRWYDRVKVDLSILKLDKPINFTDTIRPICLPTQNEAVPVGKYCVATGWGRINPNTDQAADVLQEIELPVHDSQKCADLWRDWKFINEKSAICAGPVDGSASTCQGDSGGILACQDNGRWVQQGVVSYGASAKCNDKGYPPVFSRISTFADWIKSSVRELTSL